MIPILIERDNWGINSWMRPFVEGTLFSRAATWVSWSAVFVFFELICFGFLFLIQMSLEKIKPTDLAL